MRVGDRGFLFTWFNYNNLECDYSHPGFNASHYNTYFRHFGPNPLLSWSDRECWETHLSSLNSKIPRQTSYCSQTLASLYDLHKSPPDSECRGPFDNAANYSLEDVLLLSKIASLLKLKFLRTKQEETKRNLLGVSLLLRVVMSSVCNNYSHYEQMSLAGHLLSIVTLYVTRCDTCIWCNTFVTISVTMTTGHNGSNTEWW